MNHLLKNLWMVLSPKRKNQAIFLLLFSVITSGFEVLTVGSIFNLLSLMTKINTKDENEKINSFNLFFEDFSSESVFFVFIIFLILACLCRVILLWSMLRFSHIVGSDMGVLMFTKTLKQPLEFYFKTTTSEIISNLTKKINILSLEIVHPIILVLSNIIIIIGVLGVLVLQIGIKVLLVFGVFVLLFYFFWKMTKSRISKNSKFISENSDLVIKNISETISAIKLISMKQIYSLFTDQFDKANRKLKFAEGDNVFLSQSIRLWLELIIILLGTIFCLISYKMGFLIEIIPILGGVFFGVYRVIPLVLKAYSGFSTIMGAKESFIDILSYLNLEDKFTKPSLQKSVKFCEKIKIIDLSYSYPNNKNSSITNINCCIEKNKITGILGTTGSGKTTLVSIVSGLLEPSVGNVKIDKQKLNISNIAAWKNMISYVPQETIIIDGSISDNITLGLSERNENSKIIEALKYAKLDKFIPFIHSKKTMGERGIKISGGERQRIGLARAIYDDKEIIILDEPFSALDKKTAETVLTNIRNLNKYTLIIVTHDKFVIPFCDNVITLKNGNLIKKSNEKLKAYYE